MTPLLQQVLLGTPAEPPAHPPSTRRNNLIKLAEQTRPAKLGESATRLFNLLKGNKWWNIMELSEHLDIVEMTTYSYISRHRDKKKVLSRDELEGSRWVKYYRIEP